MVNEHELDPIIDSSKQLHKLHKQLRTRIYSSMTVWGHLEVYIALWHLRYKSIHCDQNLIPNWPPKGHTPSVKTLNTKQVTSSTFNIRTQLWFSTKSQNLNLRTPAGDLAICRKGKIFYTLDLSGSCLETGLQESHLFRTLSPQAPLISILSLGLSNVVSNSPTLILPSKSGSSFQINYRRNMIDPREHG